MQGNGFKNKREVSTGFDFGGQISLAAASVTCWKHFLTREEKKKKKKKLEGGGVMNGFYLKRDERVGPETPVSFHKNTRQRE